MKEVEWHSLDSEHPVTTRSQFLIIPKRPQACQFLNQHSVPISEVISCNTNVAIGDPSCVHCNTLCKTKNTQEEDRTACQRAIAQIGRHVVRMQHSQEIRMHEPAGCTCEASDGAPIDSNKDGDHSAHIEG